MIDSARNAPRSFYSGDESEMMDRLLQPKAETKQKSWNRIGNEQRVMNKTKPRS